MDSQTDKKIKKGTKTRQERILDSVRLLKKVKEIGADRDTGYPELKGILDRWIEDGLSFSGKIPFPRYGRYIDLFLPWRSGVEPVSVLKAYPGMKEEIQLSNQ
jgi:hypothetical protein